MNQMLTLKRRLSLLEKEIRIGIIFADSYNHRLILQIHKTAGMAPVALCTNDPYSLCEFLKTLSIQFDIVKNLDELNFCIQRGRTAITENPELITSSRLINIMIESTR